LQLERTDSMRRSPASPARAGQALVRNLSGRRNRARERRHFRGLNLLTCAPAFSGRETDETFINQSLAIEKFLPSTYQSLTPFRTLNPLHAPATLKSGKPFACEPADSISFFSGATSVCNQVGLPDLALRERLRLLPADIGKRYIGPPLSPARIYLPSRRPQSSKVRFNPWGGGYARR
jgi:hypothetical protein